MRALKTVFGWNSSYSQILEENSISSLKERREDIFKRFAVKASKDSRFSHWFPLNYAPAYDVRTREKYREKCVRTERLRKSPVMTMLRVLNEEERKLRN